MLKTMALSRLSGVERLIPLMGLGERISEAIDGSGKSKAQIARECDVTGGAVTQWAHAKSLKAETALALEQATGFRAYWLMHGRGPKRTTDKTSAWPFARIEPSRLLALSAEDRSYIEGRLEAVIEGIERRTVTDEQAQQQTSAPISGTNEADQKKRLVPSKSLFEVQTGVPDEVGKAGRLPKSRGR